MRWLLDHQMYWYVACSTCRALPLLSSYGNRVRHRRSSLLPTEFQVIFQGSAPCAKMNTYTDAQQHLLEVNSFFWPRYPYFRGQHRSIEYISHQALQNCTLMPLLSQDLLLHPIGRVSRCDLVIVRPAEMITLNSVFIATTFAKSPETPFCLVKVVGSSWFDIAILIY